MNNNINKTVIREVALTSTVLEAAIKSGVVLSVLIAPNAVKLFCTMAIVQYPALPEAAAKACAHNLRLAGVPFCAYDKALGGTLGSIPAEHLRGEAVQPKVYPKAQPATRPVVKASGAPAPVAEAKAEPAAPVAEPKAELPAPVVEPAKDEPAPKEKKKRAPRAKKNLNPGVISPEEPAA